MRPRLGDDRGSVVAEFAVALPAVLVVLLVGVGALAAASRQVRLQDAVADHRVVRVAREIEHLGAGVKPGQLLGHLSAAHFGHDHVRHQQVQRLRSRGRFP